MKPAIKTIIFLMIALTPIFSNAQLPTISSLSSYSGYPGTPLTITGTNFNTTPANNIVYFGATRATVSSAGTTSLTVTIPKGATYQSVSVNNTSSALMGASSYPFLPTFNGGCTFSGFNFDTHVDYTSGTNPIGVALADFDGDGKTDIVVANASGAFVSVYHNISTSGSITAGSFAPKVDFPGNPSGMFVTTGDLDGDGKPEIIAVTSGGGRVSVYRNTCVAGTINSSSFATKVDFSTPGLTKGLSIGDLDMDGKPEIAYVSHGSTTVSVLRNITTTGSITTGSFAPRVDFPASSQPNGIAIAEIDGDGKPDIVTSNAAANTISVFRNISTPGSITTGSFATKVDFAAGNSPYGLAVGDIDGDGKIDVATANFNGNDISLIRNTATSGVINSSSMAANVNFPASTNAEYLTFGDMDGDGKPDIIVGDKTTASVYVYHNTSVTGVINSGSLATQETFGVGLNPLTVAVGDLDGDDAPDIVNVNAIVTSISVLRNNHSRGLAPITGITTVCEGSTTTLSDPTSGGTWSSGNPGIASIGSATGIVTGVSAGNAVITYSGGVGCDVTTTITVLPLPAAITGRPNVCTGASTTLSDATIGGIWTSGTPSVAVIGALSGVVNGINPGVTIITYTSPGGCETTFTMNVNAMPAAIVGTTTVCAGSSVIMSDATVGGIWTSSNIAIATVGSLTGIVAGISAGPVTISYSVVGCAVTAPITVLVSPSVITGASNICIGNTTNFSDAIGGGAWTSSATGIATIGSATGIANGISIGSAVITYMLPSGCFTTTTLTVNSAPAPITGQANICQGSSVVLSDASAGGTWSSSNMTVASIGSLSGIVFGNTIGTAVITYTLGASCASVFTVTVNPNPAPITPAGGIRICEGTTVTLSDATPGGIWSSGVPANATIGSLSGIVTGVAAGTTTISYTTISGCSSFKTITVSITPQPLAPSSANICIGANVTFTNLIGGGAWSSSAPLTANVIGGVVSGLSAGTATITYSIGTCSVTAPVTVNPNPAPISPAGAVSVCRGSFVSLSDATPGGVWSSNNSAIATVGSVTGVVNGILAGTATISYTDVLGCYSLKLVTINNAPAAIAPSSAIVCTGSTITLSDAVTGGIWTSSAPAIASVSGGLVTGNSVGAATITYAIGSCFVTASVTVNPSPNAGTITGPSTLCIGTPIALSDAVTGGVWSSSNTGIAGVSSLGVVSGVSSGNVIISYTVINSCGSAIATKTITVNASPAAGAIVGSSLLCAGTFTMMVATIPGGVWSCSNANATISVTGLLTGVMMGIDTISYTVINACGSATVTKTVTIGAYLTAGTITGPSAVCQGSAIVLSDGAPGGVWSSRNGKSTVIGGIVTGVTAGTDTISYTVTSSCGTASAIHVVTINPAPDAGVLLGHSLVCAGLYTVLTATAPGGVWSSSNSNATVSTTGLVTGVMPGAVTISYTVSNSCGTAIATKTMTIGAYLTAGTISGPVDVCAGSIIMLSDPASGGVWSASNSNAAVSGGVVVGLTGGIDTISYTVTSGCGSVSAIHIITVHALPDAGSIAGPIIVCAGASISLTTTGMSGLWSSSNATATVNSSGVVTGVLPGSDTIYYTVTNFCGTDIAASYITIGPSLSAGVTTGPGSVCAGATIVLSNPVTGGIWSSSNGNTSVAGGLVTGIAAGTDTILYTVTSSCGSASAMAVVTVLPLPFSGTITGPSSLCIGSPATYSGSVPGGTWSLSNSLATITSGGVVTPLSNGLDTIIYTVTNSCGSDTTSSVINIGSVPTAGTITGPGSVCQGSTVTLTGVIPGGIWSATNANAAVSGGVVTGNIPGTDTILYTVTTACGTALASFIININPLPSGGTITGPSALCVSGSATYSSTVPGGIWSVSNSSALISTGGLLTAVSAGIDTVSYTVTNSCGTSSATTVVVIESGSGVTISGPSSVCAGSAITLLPSIPGGAWNNSTGNATVLGGVVTGIAAGTDIISYTVTNSCGTFTDTLNISIDPLPYAGVITGSGSVCVSSVVSLSDTVTGGVWSASNTNASIAPGGIVTGILPGLDTIMYTVTNGCGVAMTSTVITINALPVVSPITGSAIVCLGSTILLSDAIPGGSWSTTNGSATVTGGVVTGVTSGADTIIYTITNACGSAVAIHAISIDALPISGSIVGASSVCQGATITVSDSVTGGVWTMSNSRATILGGNITGIAPGIDTISYTVTNSCGVAVTTKTITVRPRPYAGAISGPASVCIGSAITLYNVAPAGVWSSNDVSIATISSTGVVTGMSAGSVTMSYTVSSACGSASATYPVVVVDCHTGPTSIVEAGNRKNAELKVYPNPNSGRFTAKLIDDDNKEVSLIITNVVGQQVGSFVTESNKEAFVTLNQPPGMYLLTALANGRTYTVRIVIADAP